MSMLSILTRRIVQGIAFVLVSVSLPCVAQTLTLTNGVHTYPSLASTTVTLTGQSELHVTSGANPIPGSVIHLNSADAWFFLPNISPSVVASTYLSQVQINGANAVQGSNCRVVEYGVGTVVIPHAPSFQPLQVFSDPNFSGTTASYTQYAYYKGGALGSLNDNISSFRLKRGYTATLAQNTDGTGISRNYVAADGDVEVSLLPTDFDNSVSFIFVMPWRWVSKKGTCDTSPTEFEAQWHYNWNISQNSTLDWEYVAIKQQPYWPGLDQNWQTRQVNHLLGFNEPNNPVEDAYKNLTPPGSVDDAVARWPELLGTGLRVGAPAVTDGGQGWITDFMGKANAAGMRVDYVPVHYYRSYWNNNDPAGAANNLYNYLKAIHDMSKRPIWLTEFNNGANWTGDPDPTFAQNAAIIEAMINMMDATPWVERYSVYSAVEEVRQTHYNGGGLTPMGVMYRDHQAPVAYLQGLQDNGTRSYAELRFDGDQLDRSGYGNNAVISHAPTYTNGPNGQALVFDGTHTKVTLPPNVANKNEFSFAAWIYWKGGDDWQRIFDFGNSSTEYLFLSPRSGGGTLRLAIKNGGSEQIVETAALAQNQWKHVAVTLGGGTARLYVDGALAAQASGFTINPANFSPRMNMLGDSQFATDPSFQGMMDEVLITDVALSAAQIAALQTNTPPQFTVDSFDGGSVAEGVSYSGTIAGNATDSDAGDTLSYSKAAGPDWLTVTSTGALVGTPGEGDGGVNTFIVRVSDGAGEGDFAPLTIFVDAAATIVARYAFDGDASASVGTLHGTAVGTPTYVPGHDGQAIDLDGTVDYVTLPPGVADFDGISISTWVNWDGGAQGQRIFDFGTGTAQTMSLTPRSSGDTLRFSIKNGAIERQINTAQLPSGQWAHVVVALEGNVGRLYVNGVLKVFSPLIIIHPSDFNPTVNYIGKSQSTDPLFNGRVDEFSIYNYALSPEQIGALYTNQAPAFASDSMTFSNAVPSKAYGGTLAGTATDPDGGMLTYSKASGPAWLKVASNGTLSGTPGAANVGPNTFRVRVTDAASMSDDATLNIGMVPGSDVIGIYAFDNNVTNYTGLNPGTAFGAPAYATGVNGQAIDLDAVNDYVTLPAGMFNVSDITICMRYNWDGGDIWQRLFDFGNNTTQYMFLTPRSFSDTVRFAITTSGGGGEQRLETPMVPAGQWAHVAVVLQGNSGKLFLNGALADSNSITLNPSSFNPTVNFIGDSQWADDPFFGGLIDDLRIYNRALSDFEVANLANPSIDSDADGHSDSAETDVDTDSDGTPDYLDPDSDNDGVPDSAETYVDTDGDGTPNIHDPDSDNDGMGDGFEVAYGLNPLDETDVNTDLDGDGQSNGAEHIAGTLPNNAADYFVQRPERGAPLTVEVAGVPGRTYVLWRRSLPSGSWTGILTNGPLEEYRPVLLEDPAPPADAAYYRTSVTYP